MLFDKFFEIGLIVIGLLWVSDQILDSLIHLYDIQLSIEMKEKEESMSDSAKRMYAKPAHTEYAYA